MKALTLYQPWASLIAVGVKTIETRSWSTSYRGPLAIHAARRVGILPGSSIGQFSLYQQADGVRLLDCREHPPVTDRWIELPVGVVVATCTLTDVVPMISRWPSANPKSHDFYEGPCLYAGTQYPLALWRSQSPIFPSENVEDQRPYGDFTPGRYAWLLADVEPLTEPVPARGRQGLWNRTL